MAGFKVAKKQGSGDGDELREKFNQMNQHVVDTAGLEKSKTLVGIVSSIVDLGLQPLPDSEYALSAEDAVLSIEQLKEKYAEDIEKRGVYFAEGYNGDKKCRELMKKAPQKPLQCVAIAVDFPSKIIDKGQFFGESNPAPLRIWYGGKFWNGSEMVIQNLIALKERPITEGGKDWSLNPKSILHKMAVAAELIEDTKSVFKPERIDELLGKAFLFSAQIGFEAGKGKNAGKEFYKEKVTFTGALMEGQVAPAISRTNLVMFDGDNDEQALKELPAHVKNTMAQSPDFEKSALAKQLQALSESENSDTDKEEVGEKKEVETPLAGQDW